MDMEALQKMMAQMGGGEGGMPDMSALQGMAGEEDANADEGAKIEAVEGDSDDGEEALPDLE